jgi:hypothetical protein
MLGTHLRSLNVAAFHLSWKVHHRAAAVNVDTGSLPARGAALSRLVKRTGGRLIQCRNASTLSEGTEAD